MFGWRARIGYVAPTPCVNTTERNSVLPDGVAIIYATLDIRHLVPEEFRALSAQMEVETDWRGLFMASSFVVHAFKN